MNRLNVDELEELQHLCQLLITEGIIWESNSFGQLSPSVSVYNYDDRGNYITILPICEDVGFLLERIRNLLKMN